METSRILIATMCAGLMLLGCRTAGHPPGGQASSAELLDARWELIAIRGESISVSNEEQRPHFSLEPEEDRVVGFTGCNRMSGGYDLEADRISFGPLGVTKMACMETMELERTFLQAFGEVSRWGLEEQGLSLMNDHDQNLLTFRKSSGGIP